MSPACLIVGRGVDRLAGRVPSHLRRRARLRLQVEHGLDARHARLPRARPDPSRATTTTELTFGLLYAFTENFVAAAVPRRGGPRQGLAARRECRATAGSSSQTCGPSTATCGRTRARSSSSWAASSPRSGSGAPSGASTGTCSSCRGMRGCSGSSPTSTVSTGPSRRSGSATSTPPASAGSRPRTAPPTCSPSRASRPTGAARRSCVCNFSDVARTGYRVGLPAGGGWREILNTDAEAYGGSGVTNGLVTAAELPWGGQPWSAELALPPLSVVWLVPEGQ